MGKLNNTILLIIKGGFIGVANIIPGVSGGTIAVILGIYDKLIECIALFFSNSSKRKEYILFLTKIFIGAGISIVLLANLMDYLLKEQFNPTMFLFMGLILGGIPVFIKTHHDMKVSIGRIISFIGGFSLVLGLAFLSKKYTQGENVNPDDIITVSRYFIIGIAGFLAGGAMIVPGISGSFILVLMGQYGVIISAIKNMDIKVIGIVGVGAMMGVILFSKIIKILLKKVPSGTYYFILGLIISSLLEIFPGVTVSASGILIDAGALSMGVIVALLLSKIG